MKTTFKFFAAALAIVAAASCTEKSDVNAGVTDTAPELVEVSFQATLSSPSDPSTRTTLADDGTGSLASVHWTDGDQILLFKPDVTYGYTSNRSQLSAEQIVESSATFEGTVVASASYHALYPYAVANLNDYNTARYRLVDNTLASQNVRKDNFSTTSWGCSNIALATDTADGETLEFKNVLAHFKFSLASEGVRSIEISTEKATSYNGTFNSSYGLGGTLYAAMSDMAVGPGTAGNITVKNNDQDFVVGDTYYVAIPATKMEGLTFVFKDADGNVLHTLTKSSFDPKSNIIYNLGSIELPKLYTASSTPIAAASSLEPGKTYIIQNKGNSMYWAVVDGTLTLKSHDTSEPFTDDGMIFRFWTGSGNYPTGYNSNKVGTFRAISQNEYYLNTSFGFNSHSAGNVLNLAFCNGWIDDSGSVESGSDIDIYKVNSTDGVATAESYPLYWTGSDMSVSQKGLNMGNDARKWYIYEVK